MNKENFRSSFIPSPHDPKDYHISLFAARPRSFPEEYMISIPTKKAGRVKNQGETNTCVGHSLSTTREICEWVQSAAEMLGIQITTIITFSDLLKAVNDAIKANPNADLSSIDIEYSPGFIYADRADTDSKDEGMIPRQALKQLAANGAVPLDMFPDLGEYPELRAKFEANKTSLLKAASPHKITGFCRLHTVEDIKTALMTLGPVTIGIPVYDSFFNVGPDGLVPIPDYKTEQLSGGHETTIMGWRKDNRWVVQNSWDETWGDKGLCYMGYNFPIYEAWSQTDGIIPLTVTHLVAPPSSIPAI